MIDERRVRAAFLYGDNRSFAARLVYGWPTLGDTTLLSIPVNCCQEKDVHLKQPDKKQ